MPQYISTDPNAGMDDEPKPRLMASHEVSEGPRYLSTDPEAGEEEGSQKPSLLEHNLAPFKGAASLLKRGVEYAFDPENATAVGGALGGLVGAVGGPAGAVGGAALGGGLGAGLRRMGREATGAAGDATAGELAGEMATEGAIQGGSQAVGGALAKGAGMAGRALYGRALGANPALLKQFGKGSKEAIVGAGIEEGVIPGVAGAAEAGEQAAARAGGEARALLNASPAAQANARIKPQYIAGGLDELRAEVASRPTANVAGESIDRFEQNFLASHPKPKTLDELLTLKQGAAKEGSTAYRAAAADRTAGMDAEANEAIANRARKVLESAAPETRAANVRTKSRIGLTRALEDAGSRGRSPLLTVGDLPWIAAGGAAGNLSEYDPTGGLISAGLVPLALKSPRAVGGAGIALGRMGGGQGQTPANLLRAALLEAMRDTPAEPNQ